LSVNSGIFPGGARWGLLSLPGYWLAVVLISAAGTAVGDFISGRNMLGLSVSTAVTAVLFIAVLVIWREQSSPERETAIAAPQRATRPWGRARRCTARSNYDR
jgi:uncharacterized membrane-anchored protein